MYKILFVEDDFDHIAIYKAKLEMEGFGFVAAKTSAEAKEMVRREKPDLILLDLLLINENGMAILRQLKGDETTKEIPVVVFTNYPKPEYKDEALALGANDFIVKSDVTPAQMVERIKDILYQLHKNHNHNMP